MRHGRRLDISSVTHGCGTHLNFMVFQCWDGRPRQGLNLRKNLVKIPKVIISSS